MSAIWCAGMQPGEPLRVRADATRMVEAGFYPWHVDPFNTLSGGKVVGVGSGGD